VHYSTGAARSWAAATLVLRAGGGLVDGPDDVEVDLRDGVMPALQKLAAAADGLCQGDGDAGEAGERLGDVEGQRKEPFQFAGATVGS
jgi:hypothetical protein